VQAVGTIAGMTSSSVASPPAWSHQGFTAPFTTTGRSALVPPPPWHYAGWLLNVSFQFDADSAVPLVPPAAGRPLGSGCVHFADWQACTLHGEELLDPVLAQYRETIVVLEVERPDGSRSMYCPAIWVDQDISLVRGLLQGCGPRRWAAPGSRAACPWTTLPQHRCAPAAGWAPAWQ